MPQTLPSLSTEPTTARTDAPAALLDRLQQWFGTPLSLLEGSTGWLIRRAEVHAGDAKAFAQLARLAVRSGQVQLIGQGEPIRVVAVPLRRQGSQRLVAAGVFVVDRTPADALSPFVRRWLGPDGSVARWINDQPLWTEQGLRRMVQLAAEAIQQTSRCAQRETEADVLAEKLAEVYEEISLLYKVLENLNSAADAEQLVQLVLDWLCEVLPAETVAIRLMPLPRPDQREQGYCTSPVLLQSGRHRLPPAELKQLIARLSEDGGEEPIVFNREGRPREDDPPAWIRHLVIVPVTVQGRPCGWLAAINHGRNEWFGTIQARLLRAVANVVGIRMLLCAVEQMRRDAESAHLAKCDFLGHVSHELRTPLNAIIGLTKVLLQDGEHASPEQRHDCLETIDQSAGRLLDLINEIIEFSELQVGGVPVERIPCSLSDIITAVITQHQRKAEAKGLTLEGTLTAKSLAAVETDPARLRQLLGHLVRNAIKFTDHGWIRVETKIVHWKGQPRLQIHVRDTGRGIPPEKLDSVFDPFAKSELGPVGTSRGIGLGLALCHRIAQSLGGTLSVQSQPGQGSTFTLELPHVRLCDKRPDQPEPAVV